MTGTRSGDIVVHLGEDLVLDFVNIGHVTSDGPAAILDGDTLIGVSQNNPSASGTGKIVVLGEPPTSTVIFNSAHAPNGELRFYVPSASNVTIPAGTAMNSETFSGTVPVTRTAGIFPFAEGPYLAGADYAFYFGGAPNVGIMKTVTPTSSLERGEAITYTIVFSNSGFMTTTHVVISDPLPSQLSNVVVSPAPDAGVEITQTGDAPNLVWNVSDLGRGQGGSITVSAVIDAAISASTTFTNVVTISATVVSTVTMPGGETPVLRLPGLYKQED